MIFLNLRYQFLPNINIWSITRLTLFPRENIDSNYRQRQMDIYAQGIMAIRTNHGRACTAADVNNSLLKDMCHSMEHISLL